MFDNSGEMVGFYEEFIHIFEFLKTHHVKIAAASRTEEIEHCEELLKLLNLYDVFDYKEIFPDNKISHFEK